ncbi:MAG: AtpZ/AtpI family protein [Candidatus Omnitrophota bacterium]|nr:MAG: AtpZ/AtpI family protein [Candidatus Omnitrophota bacterium]
MAKNILYYFGLITQVGLTIIFTLLIALFIGRYLDEKFGLNGIFTIFFIFIGIGAGFFSVYKQIIDKYDKR